MRFGSSTLFLALALGAGGCGRNIDLVPGNPTVDVGVKMVGVGYAPDEVQPEQKPYGGFVEYDWVDFAGGGLSLAFMSLLSFEEVPLLSDFTPPYAMVYGQAFLFASQVVGAQNAGLVLGAPAAEDACYTTIVPEGPIWATWVDAGSEIGFYTEDGSAGFSMGRVPAEYPPDPQDVYVYYSELASWRPEPVYAELPGDSDSPEDMEPVVIKPANFPFGEQVFFEYPGGFAPKEAPVASLPLPSDATPGGKPAIVLPHRQEGLMLSWNGKKYVYDGETVVEEGEGENATCVTYNWPEDMGTPSSPEDCTQEISYGGGIGGASPIYGQYYTGPWDAEDGKVTFRWIPPEDGSDEVVTLSVRFLGPLDTDYNEYLMTNMVNYDDPSNPRGGRESMACESQEEGTWTIPDEYYDAEGNLIPALHGDPFSPVAELTCRLADDGEFELTNELLARAMAAAEERGAQGVVFYFTRTTSIDAEIPPVKDQYDQRRDASPVLVNARTVELGRFWY